MHCIRSAGLYHVYLCSVFFQCICCLIHSGLLQQGGLSAQAFVRIEIEDINDNQPIFNPETYLTSISSHTLPGTEITNVIATDRDSGIYGSVTYELVPGNFSSLFTVDTSTGTVCVYDSETTLMLHITIFIENNILLHMDKMAFSLLFFFVSLVFC